MCVYQSLLLIVFIIFEVAACDKIFNSSFGCLNDEFFDLNDKPVEVVLVFQPITMVLMFKERILNRNKKPLPLSSILNKLDLCFFDVEHYISIWQLDSHESEEFKQYSFIRLFESFTHLRSSLSKLFYKLWSIIFVCIEVCVDLLRLIIVCF